MANHLNRRAFLKTAAATAAAVSIVPRHVLGGEGVVPPSDKLTLAYIGCGTQGIREMLPLLSNQQVQIVAVCDPVKDSNEYVDWSRDGMRASIATAMGKPDWRRGLGIPGGRDVAKEIIETVYGNQRQARSFKGCTAYADFRELLEKEKDVTSVKVMTPDHLHATVSIAALNKGKQVVVHKPLANRLSEARWVIETARRTKLATHFLPASEGGFIRTIKGWIDDGAIGTLRQIHNWSNRPVWPQCPTIPTDRPAVPAGFDWDLWLGPSVDRPYHPNYTHTVFRGWYEFGGGAIADMGHYSLWPVFRLFELDAPISVESTPSHVCTIENGVSRPIRNDWSFPAACTVRFKFAAKGNRGPLELFWYDGSMKPTLPEEMEADGREFQPEGMMFVGDKGRIVANFRGERPRLIPEKRNREYQDARKAGAAAKAQQDWISDWVTGLRSGKPTVGDFLLAGPISEAFNLAAISLRMGGRRLLWDAAGMRITNVPEANRYLFREYRKGWELKPPA